MQPFRRQFSRLWAQASLLSRSTDILGSTYLVLLQIPMRGAMTMGIGGSEQNRDRRATRPDVLQGYGPSTTQC